MPTSPIVSRVSPYNPEEIAYCLTPGNEVLQPRLERALRFQLDDGLGFWWCEEFWEWDDTYCRLKGWRWKE